MLSHTEGTRYTEPHELARNIQSKAEFALDQMRIWLPALNTKTAGRGIIAGLIGLTSLACSPKPEPPPTPPPIVQVEPAPAAGSPRPPEPPIAQKETLQRKPGIYVKVLTLEQTDTPVRNHLKYIQAPVSKVIDIEAVDPQNPNNTADFSFVETADNKPRVVLRTADNNAVSFQYIVATTISAGDQKLAVEWMTTKEQQTFLRLVLDKKITKQANETDEQYKDRVTKLLKDPSYQQEIQDALGKAEQIERVVVANPYTNNVVVFDLKKEPSLVEQFFALFSPKTAYASTLPSSQPTPTESSKPAAAPTKTPGASPVEEATKARKVEIKQPEEWEKYFVAITPQQAEELLSNPVNKDKMLLPFNPTRSPKLEIEFFEWYTPSGERRVFMGLKNLEPGTVFYAPRSGKTRLGRGNLSGTLSANWSVKSENNIYSFVFVRESTQPRLPYNEEIPVKVGTPLLEFTDASTKLPFYKGGGVYQVAGGMGINSTLITIISPLNLLSIDNKLAFIK